MRRLGRNDTTFLIGVTMAVLVVFQRPLCSAIEWAHALEDSYGLAIVPGLVILAVVVLVNVLARRSDERVRSSAAQITARERDERATERGRLVSLGQSLSAARGMDGLRDVLRRFLPEFAHSGGIWALLRVGGKWEAVAGGLPATPRRASPVLEAQADRVLQFGPDALENLSINDRYGHLCGDAVLTAIGKRMRELMRMSDVTCRYGGEEFLVLLPNTPYDGAGYAAESLRRDIGKTSVTWNGETVATTASVGVAVAQHGDLDARALIGRADTALYRVKNEGRNRVRRRRLGAADHRHGHTGQRQIVPRAGDQEPSRVGGPADA